MRADLILGPPESKVHTARLSHKLQAQVLACFAADPYLHNMRDIIGQCFFVTGSAKGRQIRRQKSTIHGNSYYVNRAQSMPKLEPHFLRQAVACQLASPYHGSKRKKAFWGSRYWRLLILIALMAPPYGVEVWLSIFKRQSSLCSGASPRMARRGLALPARRAASDYIFTSFAAPQRDGLGTRHSKEFCRLYFWQLKKKTGAIMMGIATILRVLHQITDRRGL
jgi:hypothetical protein